MITLEDINTWVTLFDFDMPIELDLSDDGEYELYSWEDDTLTPNFNHDDSYFTIGEDSVVFNSDGTLTLDGYNRVNPFYLFPTVNPGISTTGQLFYFNPITNINRLVFSNDNLHNRKCYINYLGNVQMDINDNTPYRDEYGWYVPLNIIFDNEISCDVEDTKTFTPKVDYVYAPPLVNVIGTLDIGNVNNLHDKISCPVDCSIYYNNKEVSEFNVPVTGYKDVYRFRVVTKSEYPYIPSDKYVEIHSASRYLFELDDINDYSYLTLNDDVTSSLSDKVVLDSDCMVAGDDHRINSAYLVVDGNIVFEDIVFDCPVIIVNGSAEFNRCTFENNGSVDYKVINNGNLSFKECPFEDNGYIVNNGSLSISSSTFNMSDKVLDLPLIHNTGQVNLVNNNFTYDGVFSGNNIVVLRSNDIVPSILLKDNSFSYDCTVSIGSDDYTVSGDGFCYTGIDDDTLRFIHLEVD